MKVSVLSALYICLFAKIEAINNKDSEKCAACYELASHIKRSISETEVRADEEVSFDDNDGSKKSIRYGDSAQRLSDILKGACNSNTFKSQCQEVVGEQSGNIKEWFHGYRNSSLFNEKICDKNLKDCNANVVAELKKNRDSVRVEDEKRTEKNNDNIRDEYKKKSSSSASASSSSKKQEQQSSKEGFDAIAIGKAIVNRIKTNMNRIYGLSGELYGEMSLIIKAKDWNKLSLTLKNPTFWTKYWNVFIWMFLIIWTISSIIGSFFEKPKPKVDRRSSSKREKVTSSSGKSK